MANEKNLEGKNNEQNSYDNMPRILKAVNNKPDCEAELIHACSV